MSLSRIVIEQQMSQIGVSVTPSHLKITSHHPEMHVEHPKTDMKVQTEEPSFILNWQKVHNESGLMSPAALSQSNTAEAKSQTFSAIGETSAKGEFLGNVTQPGDRVARYAKNKEAQRTAPENVNMGLMPKSSPDIKWNPGSLDIDWNNHHVKIEWEGEYMPDMTVDPPHSVEVYLRNKPYFRITVEEGEPFFDTGKVVNAAV